MTGLTPGACYPAAMRLQPAHSVQCLKASGPSRVWLIRRPGQALRVLKLWTLTPWLAIKLALGIAQPQRQLRGARMLHEAGILSPRVMRGMHLLWSGMAPVIGIELDCQPGITALEAVEQSLRAPIGPRLAAECGRLVARLIDLRLFNRDLKLSNLIVAEHPDRAPMIWIIDPVGVRRMRRPTLEAARMIERLAIEPWERGIPVPRALWFSALREALRGLTREDRRAVTSRLRAHRRR